VDDRERVEILAEVLQERMASVRYIIDEWSVPQAEPVNYAQIKDLIWQIAAPLGLSMLGFSVVERAVHDDPGDIDALGTRALFAQVGEDAGVLLERFLTIAGELRY
jgi:hypothetical protein